MFALFHDIVTLTRRLESQPTDNKEIERHMNRHKDAIWINE